jgi:hypothetical protein
MSGQRAHEGVVVEKWRWGGLKVVREPMQRNESRVTGAAGTAMRVSINLIDTAIILENWTGNLQWIG